MAAAKFITPLAAAHAVIRARSTLAGWPALARPSASSEKIAIPTSSASASTQLAALWCLAWNTYRYWASRLTANKPTPSRNNSPVATATRTLPGLRLLPHLPAKAARISCSPCTGRRTGPGRCPSGPCEAAAVTV